MKKTTTAAAATQELNKAESLALQFPEIFKQLARDVTTISVASVWRSMEQAGITEADLPAMEQVITMPGFALIEKYQSFWK